LFGTYSRLAAKREDFLSPDMAARFGSEKPLVRFTDGHTGAMTPRDYQHGYRAGQTAKFSLQHQGGAMI
jgi:hypothetical protein